MFTDRAAEYVQDWDTVFRFVADGAEPLHVPEVLYHWRAHEGSSTNRKDPTTESLRSQRHVLMQQIAAQPRPELFELAPFPLPRGIPELWIRRRRIEPAPLTIVAREPSVAADARVATLGRATDYPFAAEHVIGITIEELQSLANKLKDGLVVLVGHEIEPVGDEWPWEAQGLLELHRDAVLISARILSHDRLVVAGGEVFAADGSPICPDVGRHEADPARGRSRSSSDQQAPSAVNSSSPMHAFSSRRWTTCRRMPHRSTSACGSARQRSPLDAVWPSRRSSPRWPERRSAVFKNWPGTSGGHSSSDTATSSRHRPGTQRVSGVSGRNGAEAPMLSEASNLKGRPSPSRQWVGAAMIPPTP